MKGIAFALIVVFLAFMIVYNVDGSWVFSFLENVSSLRGDSFFVWVRERLASLAVTPYEPDVSWWENALNGVAYVCKIVITPIEMLVAFVQWLISLIETAFAFFPMA